MRAYQSLLELNWNFVFSLITFIVLFFILKHFFFEKVHDFMEKRSQDIQDSLDNAEVKSREADEKLKDYEERIANVDIESRTIIKKARDEAKVQADGIVNEANEKARKAIEHSDKEIERERFNARKQLKEEVSDLAIMAAGKIMEKEITPDDHEEIVNKIIEEAEDEPWK
ncbi:F0F1 ATP synthase subunit B [Aminicella lysinilytica]|uniref:ATP synthase subunit b n=1 Tax=Aminicella lysinilytica TaxID=433323 RepID=A0A4R6Q9S9_9FIRM|nr:F0F1 ATP synthase subunit B [Aminicella lysinilytica]NLD10638.1 F0F1 ATP synthase subunit B [Clostridiales bacterium]TDP58945.1 ATP synthase F0 subcomplex B subunit [Aminicella lysinilytica]